MESDLEEGEIVEEVEDAGKRQQQVVSRRRSAGQGRKARKKSVPRRQTSTSVDRHNKRISNGIATHHQDFHRHHHHRNKSKKKPTPKRHVTEEALSETAAASSRSKLVISVNNNLTTTANPKSTKPACDTNQAPEPVRKPVKFSIKPPKKTPALVNRNYFAENLLQSLTDETSEISNGSDDDDTRSIISLPVPQKTPPELIVLDSDEENDEDVELLELRRQALEDLMAKIGREARESANKENSNGEEEEEDAPYSPPDDDPNKSLNNIENILPDELELPSIHQPPATFLALREQNSIIESAEDKVGKTLPPAANFPGQLEPAAYPLGTGDVDMRLLTYPPNVQPEPAAFVPANSGSFVQPNPATFVPPTSSNFVQPTPPNFVPASSSTFVPSNSTPISSLVQYPLYHPHRHQLNPYNSNGLLAPSNISFGFGGGPAPGNQGYTTSNNWDHRPWQYPIQQQQMAPFGFPGPVPSPNIVHPTPQFSMDHHARMPVERIARSNVFPQFAQPSVLRPIPPTSEVAGKHFRLDVDDRSIPIIPDQPVEIVPEPSAVIAPDGSSAVHERSPPASPPPEETGIVILKPPIVPAEQSTAKGKKSAAKGKQSGPKGKQSGSKGKQAGSKANKSPRSTLPKEGSKSRSKQSRRRERNSRRRAKENSERSRRTSSHRASRRRSSPSPSSRRSRQTSRDDPADSLKDHHQNVPELPPDLWPVSPVRVEENIVVAVCNEKAVPPPAEPPETSLDDSVQEDEEILRAQLLLEIANKKKFNLASASVSETASPVSIPAPAPAIQTISTVQQTLLAAAQQTLLPASQQTSGPPVKLTSVTAPLPAPAPPGPVVTPQTLTFPFPLQGTGATITKTILNARGKNRQIIRVVNNSGGPLSVGPNLTLRKTISNNATGIRPNLHTIQRTIVNTNLLKKNSYNQNADPVMRNMKITVPNQVTRLIIPAGGDSSSDEESSGGSPAKVVQSKTVPAAKRKLPIASSLLPIGFEDSLNSLLRSSRERAKPTLKPKPPPNLKHLSLAKQEEYMRLKSQLEQYERKIQKKQQLRKEVGTVEGVAGKIVPAASKLPSKVPAASKVSSEVPAVSKSPKFPPKPNAAKPSNLNMAATSSIDQPEVSSSNQASDLDDPRTTELVDQVSTSQGDKETGQVSSSLVTIAETEVTSSSSPNAFNEMTDLGASSASDQEDADMNEDQLLASDDEERIMAEANAETEEDEPAEMTQMTSAMAMDTQMTSAITTEKPFVVDSLKEREELYLREKLLKAALLKKMEASNDKLKLRKFEGDVLSSRKSINRELTSLLSEMVKLSDTKVKMKSQQEKVLMLREQLYTAEQQLSATMGKVQTFETRRKDLTSRVISMRKDFSGLVKECRKQGQKIQSDYKVPTGGALELKSKLVEVCNQNLVFRRDNQKLKLSPRKQALARRSVQPLSATLVAANRVKRSFNLRFPHTPTSKLPSTPQQFKYSARRAAGAGSSRYKGRHFNKNFGLLTKHAIDQPEESEESVFLLPKRHFKDVMMGPEVKPLPRGWIPIVPYSVYESPLSSIREPGPSDRDSSTPALGRNLDPFVTLCYFELRGMCNSVKCPFQHLYRPKTSTTTVMAD